MGNEEIFDAIIAGGGLAAAYTLTQEGLDVLAWPM